MPITTAVKEYFQLDTVCGLEISFKSERQRAMWIKLHGKKCERCAGANTSLSSHHHHLNLSGFNRENAIREQILADMRTNESSLR